MDDGMKQLIRLDTHYTRSINLERDAYSCDVLKAYIPTSRATKTLERIANSFNKQNMPRAWSLIGPYGAGKSSFAVFLSHLLENHQSSTSGIAEGILSKQNQEVAQKFKSHNRESNGCCIALIAGGPESLSRRVVAALHKAGRDYFNSIGVNASPEIVDDLENAAYSDLSPNKIILLIKKLRQAVLEANGNGILIIIDELGKFLEYEVRHQGSNEIFLLQALAELAYLGDKVNLMLVVLMHQSFEQYSKGLVETLRNEWMKVQGRFENIPFLESSEQTLRVISAAFQSQLSQDEHSVINKKTADIVKVLEEENALLSGLSAQSATEILSRCYPLHPVSAMLLPFLCQKVAQNERTLFSYLGSQENFGFKYSLERLERFGDWVLPSELFDYFIENQPSSTTDHITHRRWAEVVTALERLGDADELEAQLLKTIGLFNIIGRQAGLKASSRILQICLHETADVPKALGSLEKKSIINFRRYSSEYRVWEGSDFDLESAILATSQQIGRISLADVLTRRNRLAPVVARRYSISNGVFRCFQTYYGDAASSDSFFKNTDHPRIMFLLGEGLEEQDQLEAIAKRFANPLTLYVICENVHQLRHVVTEINALESIQSENALLRSDPVAQRELKDRLQALKDTEESLLDSYLEDSGTNYLYWEGNQKLLPNRKKLQELLSEVLETVFNRAPLVMNELINRNKTSSQVNAARNKLLGAMLSNMHMEDLGFEAHKYPPEKTIYRAVFKESGIHKERNGGWEFVRPTPDNKCRFIGVWDAIDDLLRNSKGPQRITDIYKKIEAPPYGLQKGVSPLILVAYYLANQRSIAIYEGSVFCPIVNQELLEILLRRPELFSIESFELKGIRAEVFNQYFDRIIGKAPDESTILDIVKPLARFMSGLPVYTLNTKSLGQRTTAVREAFENAQSPVKLLFETLPKACGFESLLDDDGPSSIPTDFLNELVNHLNSLNNAYSQLLDDFRLQLSQSLNEKSDITLQELRKNIRSKYAGLEQYTTDLQGLKAFITRLQNDNVEDLSWLESIAAFLGKAPPSKWLTNNQVDAGYRLSEFSDRLEQLALLHSHQLSADAGTEVTIFRVMGQTNSQDQIVYLNPQLKAQAIGTIENFKSVFESSDKQLKLAIIAELLSQIH